jgi:D-aminopeptidase
VTGGNVAQQRTVLPTDAVSGLFEATLDASEEAIYNSMLKATDATGSGRTIRALPVEELRIVLKKYGR